MILDIFRSREIPFALDQRDWEITTTVILLNYITVFHGNDNLSTGVSFFEIANSCGRFI